jgi:hypothetical protein
LDRRSPFSLVKIAQIGGAHPVATLCLALLAPFTAAMRLEPGASELLRSFAAMMEKVGWGRDPHGIYMGMDQYLLIPFLMG